MTDGPRTIWRVLLVSASVATVLRILWAGSVDLAPDEAWYWSWGREPALGYRDHPPLIGWIMALIPTPVGYASEVWVRLPALVSGLVLVPLAYTLARVAGAARWCALLAALTGSFSLMGCAGAVIATPDAPLMVFWTLALILAVRLATGGSRWLLPAAAAAAGAACLAKLPGLLVLPGIVAAVIARRSLGMRMAAPGGAAVVVLGILLAPLAAGELGPGAGPAAFQLERFSALQFGPAGPIAFLAAAAGLAGLLPVAGAASLGPLPGLRSKPAVGILGWTFWPPLAGCTLLGAAVHVEPNWGAIAFPSLFAGWALLIDRIARRRAALARWLGGAALGLNLALALVAHLHAAGVLAPSLVGRGPAARLHGWRQIADVIATTGPWRLETQDYALQAPLAYYARGRIEVVLVRDAGSGAQGEPEAVWTIEDRRLGIVRSVEAVRTEEGGLRIRVARR